MTQEELAETVGCATRYVQRIEQGRANLTLRFVASLAAALETDVGSFFAATAIAPNPRKPGRPRRKRKAHRD